MAEPPRMFLRLVGRMLHPRPSPPSPQLSPKVDASSSTTTINPPLNVRASPATPYETINGYEVCELIGVGSYGRVYTARSPPEHRDPQPLNVALKCVCVPPKRTEIEKHALDEIDALMNLKGHPNVLRIYRHWRHEVSATYYIVTELCSIDLLTVLQRAEKDPTLGRRLPEETVRKIFRQLASALAYMHTNCIAHGDVKCDNVMFLRVPNVTLGTDLDLRLVDFGFSVPVSSKSEARSRNFRGSHEYAAPELLLGRASNALQTDCWSLGAVLYAMLCLSLPFLNVSTNAGSFERATRGQYAPLPPDASESARDIVASLMCVDRNARFTAHEAYAHPWTKPP